MREVSGSTWTFQIIIIFIFIFACFLTLVLNYSKAFTVKNEMISILEKYEGATNESLTIINNYLKENGYKTVSYCPDGWHGAINLDGGASSVEEADPNKKYYYCFIEGSATGQIYTNGKTFNQIKVFYKFNLPFIGELVTFQVRGRTNSYIGSEDRIGA